MPEYLRMVSSLGYYINQYYIILYYISENFSRGQAYLAQGTDPFFKQNADNLKSATANHVTLYCNARVMNIMKNIATLLCVVLEIEITIIKYKFT